MRLTAVRIRGRILPGVFTSPVDVAGKESGWQIDLKGELGMFIVHVHVYVKPEYEDAFRQATIDNASSSLKEPGITRFDVVQDLDDSTHFVLVEVYRTREASA